MDNSGHAAPLVLFAEERAKALSANDPMAGVCTAASLTPANRLDIRTLVLRDLEPGYGLFANGSSVASHKWTYWLRETFAVQTYWPSQQVQYRLQCRAEELAREIVAESWLQRPSAPKRMDWLYETQPQSSSIESREALLSALDAISTEAEIQAPQSARGLRLIPIEIERLFLGTENGVHNRTRHRLTSDGEWRMETLVP